MAQLGLGRSMAFIHSKYSILQCLTEIYVTFYFLLNYTGSLNITQKTSKTQINVKLPIGGALVNNHNAHFGIYISVHLSVYLSIFRHNHNIRVTKSKIQQNKRDERTVFSAWFQSPKQADVHTATPVLGHSGCSQHLTVTKRL